MHIQLYHNYSCTIKSLTNLLRPAACMPQVRLYEAQGYGAAINYEIAAPLLADMAQSLTSAAAAQGPPPQRARLMFAHMETLVPLASLMGLFQPPADELPAVDETQLEAMEVGELEAR